MEFEWDENIMTINNSKMDTKKIHWRTILKKIEDGESLEGIEADFNNESILWKDAMILGRNGIEVPQELVDYDDENIDYSDIPSITDEDIKSGKIKWTINAELALEKEIADWIKEENININEFAAKLIRDFYDEIKSLPKTNHYK